MLSEQHNTYSLLLYCVLLFCMGAFNCVVNQSVDDDDSNFFKKLDECSCGIHGSCLIDECLCEAGYTGDFCNESKPILSDKCLSYPTDDVCQNVDLYGRFRAPPSQKRQERAAACATKFWERHEAPDRIKDQVLVFQNFSALPYNLGRVLEVGPGPYTKTKLILESNLELNVRKVMLVDPLMDELTSNEKIRTSYSTGRLQARGLFVPTSLFTEKGEKPLRRNFFDTVILINTLGRCSDAVEVLSNLYRTLKKGGILIFGERFATDKELSKGNACNPIQLTKRFLDLSLDKFSGDFLLGPITGQNVTGVQHGDVRRSLFAIVRKG